MVDRYAVVRRFVPKLCETIEFGATADAAGVLDALRGLPELLDARPTKRVPTGYLDQAAVAVDVVAAGWWQRLVFPPNRPEGMVDRAGYVFCVLEQFHQRLRRRDIFATASGKRPAPTMAGRLTALPVHRPDSPQHPKLCVADKAACSSTMSTSSSASRAANQAAGR